MSKEIIILGRSDNMSLCPYDKDVWTLTSVVPLVKQKEKIVRCFDLHFDYTDLRKSGLGLDCEYVVFKKPPKEGITYSYYPLKEIYNALGVMYFCSTIGYMIALAIHEGVKRIDIYGVDLEGEMFAQKENAEFWIGYFSGS